MKKKLSHNKYKNTGLLFELLVAKITTEVINNNEDKYALRILKKFFKKDSLLSEEFTLYQTLLESAEIENTMATHELVNEILKQRKKIDIPTLNKEKYKLVETIKRFYNLDEIIQSRVPDFKELATIYKLFEYEIDDNPVEYSKLKTIIIELKSPADPETKINEVQAGIKNTLPDDNDIRILSYKLMIKKFNEKYETILSNDQKRILKEYVSNVTNSKLLTEFVKVELDKVLKKINKQVIVNEVLEVKVEEVKHLLENLKGKYIMNDNDITILMNGYELIKFLK
jgi:hypothetical protein